MKNPTLATTLVLAAIAFLSACQNDTVASPDQPRMASLEFEVKDAYRQPDSARWALRGKGDSADLVRAPHSSVFLASFLLPEAPGGDRVSVQLWRDGIRTDVVSCTGEDDLTFSSDDVERDSAAYAILRKREALALKEPDVYTDDAVGARRAFAKMLVEREASTKGALADGRPFGIDTAALADEICRAMASTGKSFGDLWSIEQLGGDSAAWAAKVRARVASKVLTSVDSARLFPPLPVREEVPVTVAKRLVAGGDEIAIDGRFGWFPGLVALDAFVLSGTDTVRGVFDVALEQPRRKTDTIWNLAGRANVRARSKAAKGMYTLGVVARDVKGRRAVSTTPLEVVEPAPGTPRLSRIEPQGDTVEIPFETGSLHVSFKVLNPEDVDESSVSIGGIKATKKSATQWEGDVAVPPTGRAVIVSMRAVGKNGEPGTDYLLAVRAGDPVAPSIDSVEGSADRTVPFATTSALVRWKIYDNHMVDLVEIGGIEAKSKDSIYSRTVALAVGENLVETEAFDSSSNVARKVVRIVRSKDDQAPVCIRDLGAHDTDITSQSVKFVLMGWQITDNHRVESVTIGGVAADRSGGFYYRVVPVQTGATKVALVARDSSGNQSTDTVLVRKEPNPGYPVLKALSGTETRTVDFDTSELKVGWQVLNPGSLQEVKINGSKVAGIDAVYSLLVKLPVGDTVVEIEATDTLDTPAFAKVTITRKKDTVPPSVAQGHIRFLTVGGKTKAEVGWVVEDNDKIKSVVIDGVPVLPDGIVYTRSFEVPAEQSEIIIEATDMSGNNASDKVVVDRTPDTKAPVIERRAETVSHEVESGVETALVSWTVSDDHDVDLVAIDGQQTFGRAGIYARYVQLDKGANTIKIVAKDPSGNEASDEVVITRK